MKKIYLCIVLACAFFTQLFGHAADQPVSNPYQAFFDEAYIQNPSIPRGMLEAVSFTQTRFNHITAGAAQSCIGMPQAYGVMGLILDGKNYFRNNLILASQLSGYSVDEIISSPEKNILAYAKAYSQLLANSSVDKTSIEQHAEILRALSELPVDNNPVNHFALNSHLYSVYVFLNDAQNQSAYKFPAWHADLSKIFGENLKVLSAGKISLAETEITNEKGDTYKNSQGNSTQSADYAPALWNPAASCNYSSRNGTAISAVTIHDVEGSYAGCISWFQNCAASVSAHYVVRSSDGQITQMVLEVNKAWHVGTENPYTIGIEHEGYQAQTGWYTNAMYTASAGLVRDICNSSGYGINPLRTYHGPACSGSCVLGSCIKVKGHQHFPNQTHNDPGPNWDWYYFYTLVNNNPTVTTYTAGTGTFYDSGGPTGNYQNDQRTVALIQPAGASNATVTFTQFSLENSWDYMYIYDGNSTTSPFLGRYTGTALPGTITSSGGSLLLDFRSDCATTDSGWAISYTSNTTTGTDVTPPTTQSNVNGTWQTQNFSATFTDADNVGGSGLEKRFYQVIDYNGTEWRANNTHGFFADNFDAAIHSDWTTKTGSWSINGQALFQSDTSLANTNVYAPLTQNLSNRYLYHFIMKIGSLGTNRRAGFHFMCTQPDSSNRGDGYFVWFRVDQSQLQIYKVANNSFGSPVYTSTVTVNPNQYYDYKVIFDRISGLMRVYQNNVLIGSWTDSSPYNNGTYVSFRSGNANMYVDELKIYRSRAATVNVTVGPGNTKDIRYQNPNPSTFAGKIKSICSDSAANLSSIAYDNINIDWTVPLTVDSVRDGVGADINITNSKTSLSANWSASFDQESNVAQYWYCVGTTPGDSNTVGWTGNMVAQSVTVNGLNLVQNQYYYFTVKAVDGAGLVSIKTASDGQKVDTLFGTTSLPAVAAQLNTFVLYPNPASEYLNAQFTLTTDANVEMTMYDALGQKVFALDNFYVAGSHIKQIDVTVIPKGIYLLCVKVNGMQKTFKVMTD